MSRACLALVLSSGLWAQTPGDFFDKPPSDVDDALRDRITKFYQAHVDRKFRQADQYVAEDTKDFYYEANKPTYLEFQIGKIVYSDNFTKAKAIVNCKMRVNMPGFTDTPLMVPTPSTWKLEKGQWCWYVDQTVGRETPFGRMRPPEGTAPGGALPSLATAPDLQALWKNVQADKNHAQLSLSRESSDEITISSKMPGAISLSLFYPKTPGLEAALDRMELKPGEQAKVRLRWQPREKSSAKTVEVDVMVQPTNQVIPITVVIQ